MCACTMCVCVVPPTLAKHPPRVVQGCRCLPTGVGGLPSQLIRCQPGAEVHQRWAAEAEDGDARPIPRPIAVWHDAPAGGPTAVPSRFPFANPKMGLGYMPPALGSVWGRFFSCCQSTAPPPPGGRSKALLMAPTQRKARVTVGMHFDCSHTLQTYGCVRANLYMSMEC